MNELKKELTLKEGIPLAVGSIIGSGILFLPSLTYSIGHSNVLLIWAIATAICLPMIFIFTDMVKTATDGSGIEGFVSLGLGKHAGASIPILLLSTVSLGMPSAALIAGEYLKNLLHGPQFIQYLCAFALIYIGIGTNLVGLKAGAFIQNLITALLFLISIILLSLTFPQARGLYHQLQPNYSLPSILSGIVVAFWAYAGFENLTFIAGEFKNPKKDFFLSIIIAFIVCGLLYIGLSANYAAIIPYSEVNEIAGLFQLAERIPPTNLTTFIITIFALTAVQINLNSWTWGISRLIFSSAKSGKMPAYFQKLDQNNLPKRSIILLGFVFSITLFLSMIFPNFLKQGLILVSSNFVFIYVLCLLSYLKGCAPFARKFIALIIMALLIISLSSSGLKLIYPVSIFLISYFFSKKSKLKTYLEKDDGTLAARKTTQNEKWEVL